ncbi:hypothetical protein FFH90_006080 [Pseudomonas sp. ATCC 43928]|nr:hypothetical protein [Pseudomonas sp. PDM08]MBD9620972.1 hypothetical protein [Pseudomonas sp. PDM07]QDV98341.1 hypothetical protein FFH90_006080 [Pseudomonas sp. ATCC 43928]
MLRHNPIGLISCCHRLISSKMTNGGFRVIANKEKD